MDFLEIEINEGIEVNQIYTLPRLVKKMPDSFYEKWDQHLNNTTKTQQELYEENYHLEFNKIEYNYLINCYIVNKDKKIIGELSAWYMLPQDHSYDDEYGCSFCKNSYKYNEIKSIYERFNSVNDKWFGIRKVEGFSYSCKTCDIGIIKIYEYEEPTTEETKAVVLIKSIELYDQFDYFENKSLGLEVK